MKRNTQAVARSSISGTYVSNPATYSTQINVTTNTPQSMGYTANVSQSTEGHYISTSSATRDAYRDLNKSISGF